MADQYTQLRREWGALAPKWIEEARTGGHVHRKGMLDGYMLSLCGDVSESAHP